MLLWSTLLSLACASIVQPDLDLDIVKQYAGLFNVTHGSLFFYMFESRHCACGAPVIIWLNGGPGASSMPAILFENGPSSIQLDGSINSNPYSWNEFANVVYLDNPVGAGFSVPANTDEPLYNSEQASVDFVDFINAFYQQFPEFEAVDLHIAGESYAGTYIPVYAEALVNSGRKLKSIMIGDGQVDYGDAIISNYGFFCGKDNVEQLIPDQNCTAMADEYDTCKKLLEACTASLGQDMDICGAAAGNCTNIQSAPGFFAATGGNPYNVKAQCQASNEGLCYEITDVASEFFNSTSTKKALGVDPSYDFETISAYVSNNWDALEGFSGIPNKVKSLLDQGVEVLAYGGDLDGVIPFSSQTAWTTGLDWSGASDFKASVDSPQTWYVDGASKGEVSNSGPLTLLKVYNAGHMVPMDQPAAASAMAKAWVEGNLKLQ